MLPGSFFKEPVPWENKDKDDKVYDVLNGYTKDELIHYLLDIISDSHKDEIITNFESQCPDLGV